MSVNALLLDGWDHTSTWGTDNGEFYAQLTPNGVPQDDSPQVWITPPQYAVDDAKSLACAIAAVTGAGVDDVVQAMQRGAGPDGPETRGG